MQGSRFLSALAGIIIGGLIGWWIYAFIGYFLFCGPIEGDMISWDLRMIFFGYSVKFGVIPGVAVGFLGGLVLPFTLPRGHMSKSIGTSSFLIIAPLAWWSQWGKLAHTSGGRIALMVFITFIVFLIIVPVSGYIGGFIESMREPK